ncbi:MAG: hypothetical protein OXD29_02275 [Roseovarius sp.]|nr:hypothetical protein [Roseovarius sp.]MCY4314655.1 hypothetical protein [Roseovarius sp.]
MIRSYRQLNTGKFSTLHELEERLTFPFFKREWEILEEGKKINRYWKLTIVETGLPAIFFIISIFVIAMSGFDPLVAEGKSQVKWPMAVLKNQNRSPD